jgi:hypothetical protein
VLKSPVASAHPEKKSKEIIILEKTCHTLNLVRRHFARPAILWT